jgi:hypothetical protein
MPKKITQEEFIKKAINVHGDKYSYHLVNYVNSEKHVSIWCNTCLKYFYQAPDKHSNGKQGCKDCHLKKSSENNRMTIDDVISKSKLKHGDIFSYEFINYKNQDSIVNLVCKKHNHSFSQTVYAHKFTQYPCSICLHEFQKNKTNAWSHSHWVKTGLSSKNFVAFQLYVLRCWNENEAFHKIGKTFTNIAYRFSGGKMPYNYEIIHVLVDEGLIISKKEDYYKSLNKNNIYNPLIKFNGSAECFINLDIRLIT